MTKADALPSLEHVILRVEVGSTAYGTALAGTDDHDEVAVTIEPLTECLGVSAGQGNRFDRTAAEGERSTAADTDRQVYSLRSFCRLAVKGNPSIIGCFWAPTLPGTTTVGEELRALASSFLSQRVVRQYRGYMQSQTERIVGTKGSGGHGQRGSGGRAELIEQHGFDTKFAMHAVRLGFQCLELAETGGLEYPIPPAAGEWLRALRRGEVPFTEWWDIVLDLDARLGRLLTWCPWPPEADVAAINEALVGMHLTYWGR